MPWSAAAAASAAGAGSEASEASGSGSGAAVGATAAAIGGGELSTKSCFGGLALQQQHHLAYSQDKTSTQVLYTTHIYLKKCRLEIVLISLNIKDKNHGSKLVSVTHRLCRTWAWRVCSRGSRWGFLSRCLWSCPGDCCPERAASGFLRWSCGSTLLYSGEKKENV